MENTNCNCLENIINKVNLVQDFINEKLLDITKTECSRMNNENERIKNETARHKAECDRITNENVRQEGYNKIVKLTDKYTENEKRRLLNELEIINNENKRLLWESCRKDAENIRKELESSRQAAETLRITSEINRIENENLRKLAEEARVAAEKAREMRGYYKNIIETEEDGVYIVDSNMNVGGIYPEEENKIYDDTRLNPVLTLLNNNADKPKDGSVLYYSTGTFTWQSVSDFISYLQNIYSGALKYDIIGELNQ